MEIGPILRALINHRSRFVLITVEIALTLAIVANCVNMVLDQRAKVMRPTGIDEANILVATVEPFEKQFEDEKFLKTVYGEDLHALQAISGVRAVTATTAVPLSGGGSSTGRKPVGKEVDPSGAPYFIVDAGALDTLGLVLVEGRDFDPSDFPDIDAENGWFSSDECNVIVTRNLADVLFPDGGALGSQITSGGDDPEINTIVGIVERMHSSWPMSNAPERVMLVPGHPTQTRATTYLVRAEPGQAQGVFKTIEDVLLGVNKDRLVTVRTLSDIKAETYASLTAFTQLLGGLSVLLIVVTSLGIVGLTSFSVTQRTHEIGTRRALGATRLAIVRHFLVENWLVTGIGLSMGLILTVGLNFALAKWAEVPRIGVVHIAVGIAVLWGAGLLAALAPALRAMLVSPVIATRNVY